MRAALALLACLTIRAAAQEAGPVIRATSREVALDLVVRDGHGRQVKDLKPDDVQIFEDGVPQKILGFRLVPGREAGEAQAPPRPVSGLRSVNLICLVFHNILGDPDKLRNALDGARQFLAQPFAPGTCAGVFRLDDGLVTLHPFTANREELVRAARNGFAAPAANLDRAAAELRSSIPGLASESLPAQKTVARGGIAAMRGFVYDDPRPQFDQLKAMIRQLDGLPGRKTVVLFSRGVLNPTYTDWLQAVVDLANRAHITFYVMDLTGQVSGISADREKDLPTERPNWDSLAGSDQKQRNSDAQIALRTLARATGGEIFVTRDFKKSFQRVFEDVNTHYEASYHPSSDKLDAHLRRIAVRLSRPGLTVDTRTGYFAVPDAAAAAPSSFETAAFTALAASTPPHDFDFRSAALRFRPGPTASDAVIAYEIPGANLTATALADGNKHRIHYSLLVLVKDSSGQTVAKLSRDFPGEIDDAQVAALREGAVVYSAPIKILHGHYTVETAVVDHEGGRSSTSSFEVAGQACNGVCMSDPVLVQEVERGAGQGDVNDPLRIPAGRVIPELSPNLSPGAQPRIYFVIYPEKNNPERPQVSMKVLAGSEVTAEALDVPAPDASGAIPMLIRVKSNPGEREVRLAVRQGEHSAERVLRYWIAETAAQ